MPAATKTRPTTYTRAQEARQAEDTWKDQLAARAGADYSGRMRLPPPRQREAVRFGGGTHARGTGGLYDWFYELDPDEQQRIRANWMSPQGFKVDEMEDRISISEWLSVTRRIDMARAIGKGRHIERKRYGNLDPDNVVLSGRKLSDMHRSARAARKARTEDSQSSRCHFFTDDDGIVHPIAATCGHVKHITAKQRRETYGDDEAF